MSLKTMAVGAARSISEMKFTGDVVWKIVVAAFFCGMLWSGWKFTTEKLMTGFNNLLAGQEEHKKLLAGVTKDLRVIKNTQSEQIRELGNVAGTRMYVTQDGDTAYTIARKLQVPLDTITENNPHLGNMADIDEGTIIKYPKGNLKKKR